MKYLKVKFKIAAADGSHIEDEVLTQTVKDVVCSLAGDVGFDSFEEEADGICGYVQTALFSGEALDGAIAFLPIEGVNVTYDVAEAEDKNWNRTWEEQGFEPIVIENKCVIHDMRHGDVSVSSGMMDVTIDARQAFGTGTHDTTKMIVTELLSLGLAGKSVLDCGCGTGILSIVASKCGAEEVTGYDIDEWSVENTGHNCEINSVDNVKAVEGTAEVIPTFNKRFDVVLANINRNILLADMPSFRSAMADGGVLILSGFYTADTDLLKDKAASLGLHFVKSTDSNDWCMLEFAL